MTLADQILVNIVEGKREENIKIMLADQKKFIEAMNTLQQQKFFNPKNEKLTAKAKQYAKKLIEQN